MKDRILFWLSRDMVHFGIAKYLQEKYDSDIYAIIETHDKPRKFFQEQQLVHFSKVWYFHDHVSIIPKKPDLKYLISLEERYKINLWLIAYSERLFLKYNKYHKFTNNEILSLFEQECRFFEGLLDEVKPDFLVLRLTDFHHIHLLYEICKARGVKILMLHLNTKFGGRWIISKEANKLDQIENQEENYSDNDVGEELRDYLESFDPFNQANKMTVQGTMGIRQFFKWKAIKSVLRIFLASGDNNDRDRFLDHGRTRLKVVSKVFPLLLKGKFRQFFVDRNFNREIKEDEKFVYFPLHFEPERALLIAAPFYSNQLEVITNIAKSLPVDYKLYVKEHPLMKVAHWRTISYYKQIMSLPNVRLIHPSVSPKEIMKSCSLVITIGGTASLEAAFYKKPSIVFVDVNFSHLPFVHKLKSMEELPVAIRTSLQRKVDHSELNKFVNLIHKNTFEFDAMSLDDESNPFHGTLISDIEIPIPKMKSFLENHKSVFEKLALEHIKKIKQYKEYESKNSLSSI